MSGLVEELGPETAAGMRTRLPEASSLNYKAGKGLVRTWLLPLFILDVS